MTDDETEKLKAQLAIAREALGKGILIVQSLSGGLLNGSLIHPQLKDIYRINKQAKEDMDKLNV